jgi:hypothetical protein
MKEVDPQPHAVNEGHGFRVEGCLGCYNSWVFGAPPSGAPLAYSVGVVMRLSSSLFAFVGLIGLAGTGSHMAQAAEPRPAPPPAAADAPAEASQQAPPAGPPQQPQEQPQQQQPQQQQDFPIPPSVQAAPIPAAGGGYCFGGPHPAPGGGWEDTQSPHVHTYAPFDLRLFSYENGCYYFIGDPHDFGYTGQVYSYYGAHPIADTYGGGWCFMVGPHSHWWRPWSPYFTVVGPWYYWNGPYDPFFWAYWPFYSFYYRSYYPRFYAGGRYFSGGYRAAPPISRVPASAGAGWRAAPAGAVGGGAWRGGAAGAGAWRGAPAGAAAGGWRGAPAGAAAGGWRGAAPATQGGWRGGSVPSYAGPRGGGGFQNGGGFRGGGGGFHIHGR